MNIVRHAFLLLIIILSGFKVCCGQTSDSMKIIYIKPYALDKRVSILFQNDKYIILTSTAFLTNFYSDSTKKDYWTETETKLFSNCLSTKNDTTNYFAYAKKNNMEHVLINRTAKFLKANNCVVMNRVTKELVEIIYTKDYEAESFGGTEYIIDKTLFITIERVY